MVNCEWSSIILIKKWSYLSYIVISYQSLEWNLNRVLLSAWFFKFFLNLIYLLEVVAWKIYGLRIFLDCVKTVINQVKCKMIKCCVVEWHVNLAKVKHHCIDSYLLSRKWEIFVMVRTLLLFTKTRLCRSEKISHTKMAHFLKEKNMKISQANKLHHCKSEIYMKFYYFIIILLLKIDIIRDLILSCFILFILEIFFLIWLFILQI